MNQQKEETDVNKFDDVIEKVETFIQRIQDLDFVINPTSGSLIYGEGENARTLSDLLVESITSYEVDRYDSDPKVKILSAYRCLVQINRAFACGIIKEGEALISKFKKRSEENIKLRRELETVSDSLMRAKERIEELEQMMPNAGSENA